MRQAAPSARAARLGLDVELRAICNTGQPHPCHWHDDLQIIAAVEGRGEATVEGKSHMLRSGTLIVIPPGLVHTAIAAPGQRWTFLSLHAAPERLGASAAGVVVSARDDPADLLFGRFERVTAALFNKGKSNDALPAFDALLSDIASRAPDPPDVSRVASAHLLAARATLAANLGERVSVPAIAAQYGWSAGHFSREFARAFFMPPLAWRLNARLEVAKRHLRQGGTVASAAAMAGFANLSHFSRTYRQSTGITARTYGARSSPRREWQPR